VFGFGVEYGRKKDVISTGTQCSGEISNSGIIESNFRFLRFALLWRASVEMTANIVFNYE